MPQKKKRSGGQTKLKNQVKVLTTVASRKKPTAKAKQTKKTTASKPLPKEKKTSSLMPKQAVKNPSKKTRPRKTPAAKRKKSEVKLKVEVEPQKNTDEDVKELLDVLENDDDKQPEQNSTENEIIFVQSEEASDPHEPHCEIIQPLNNEIVEQLENLNVAEETSYINEGDNTVIHEVVEIDNFSEFTVECVSEEFVPIAENAEIIIEEADSNEYSEQIEAHFEKIHVSDSLETTEITEEEETLQVETTVEENVEDAGIKKTKKKPVKKDNKQVKKVIGKKKVTKPKPVKKEPLATKTAPDKTDEVRRSSRIKSINVLRQRIKGHGLVKQQKSSDIESNDNSNASTPDIEKSLDVSNVTTPNEAETNKPVKVKSRWRKSSELEMNILTPAVMVAESCGDSDKIAEINEMLVNKPITIADEEEVALRLKQFIHLKENQYKTDRMTCKEAKKMSCDCFLMAEEIERGERGCGEDCLNRLLMIEW